MQGQVQTNVYSREKLGSQSKAVRHCAHMIESTLCGLEDKDPATIKATQHKGIYVRDVLNPVNQGVWKCRANAFYQKMGGSTRDRLRAKLAQKSS